MDNCIFCKIAAGEIPSYKIYEDDLFFGFLDIHPRVFGHTLLVPKKHYKWVYDVPDFDKYWLAALKITNIFKKELNTEFVTYGTHGLDISHAHIHILPRKEEVDFLPKEISIDVSEMEKFTKKIQNSY
jgi:histidine triad (HIT) family protein